MVMSRRMISASSSGVTLLRLSGYRSKRSMISVSLVRLSTCWVMICRRSSILLVTVGRMMSPGTFWGCTTTRQEAS